MNNLTKQMLDRCALPIPVHVMCFFLKKVQRKASGCLNHEVVCPTSSPPPQKILLMSHDYGCKKNLPWLNRNEDIINMDLRWTGCEGWRGM